MSASISTSSSSFPISPPFSSTSTSNNNQFLHQAPQPPPLISNPSTRKRTPSTSSKGGLIITDDDEDHDEYLEGDELDEDDEADHEIDEINQQSESEALDETTVKSGYLWKKGEKRKNWKKRWFVLRSSKLAYYKNEKEYQLLRLLDMSEVHTVASVAMKKNEHAFGIVTPKRTYYVKASSKSEMLSWIESLMGVKTQLQMRSTLTQELAATEISGINSNNNSHSNPHSGPSKIGKSQSKERSPNVSESSENGIGGGRISPSRPISITIPGQGTYVSPAQPRPIPSPGGLSIPIKNPTFQSVGSQAFSPLTSTSISGGSGSDNGAEQYGLSYQSSAGFSASSGSPTRGTTDLSPNSNFNNLSHSPQSVGEMSDASRGGGGGGGCNSRSNSKNRNRSRGEDSSDGVGGGNDRPVSPSRSGSKSVGGGGNQGYFGSGSGSGGNNGKAVTPGATGALSSSDEDDGDGDCEGEDWDEDEIADRAMPLPGLIPGSNTASSSQQQQQQTNQTQPSSTTSTTTNQSSNNPQIKTTIQPPSQLKDPSKIIMQGYLMKQSNRRKHWRKRWFVLNGLNLTYSRSHMDSKNNRQIPLSSILDAIEYTSKKQSLSSINSNGNGSSPLSPSLASPNTTNQTFNFNNHDDSNGEKVEREVLSNTEGINSREESNSNSTSINQHHPLPPSKVERRTSLVAAAANIGERLGAGVVGSIGSSGGSGGGGVGGSTSSNSHQSSTTITGGNSFSTSPTLGGTSPLPNTSPNQQQKKKKENCFKIITPKRTFVVCAPTEEEEIKWLGAIQALLMRSRGSTTITTITANSNSGMNTNQTTGFTLDLSNHQKQQQQQQHESSSNVAAAQQQSPTQMAPIASGFEESALLPLP